MKTKIKSYNLNLDYLGELSLDKVGYLIHIGAIQNISDSKVVVDNSKISKIKPLYCVVCGSTQELTKHHIVPYAFIRRMVDKRVPNLFNVIPVCVQCHCIYERFSDIRKKEIARKYDLNINGIDKDKKKIYVRAISNAKTILHKKEIPEHAVRQMKNSILKAFPESDLSHQEIFKISQMTIQELPIYTDFYQSVVNCCDNLQQFSLEWWKHFNETMKPKYLPAEWSP